MQLLKFYEIICSYVSARVEKWWNYNQNKFTYHRLYKILEACFSQINSFFLNFSFKAWPWISYLFTQPQKKEISSKKAQVKLILKCDALRYRNVKNLPVFIDRPTNKFGIGLIFKQNHFFFLSTPTVFPLLPVVLVCCPLTLSPHLCLRPRLHLILNNLSTSSLSLV